MDIDLVLCMKKRSLIKVGIFFIGMIYCAGISIAAQAGWKIDGRHGHNRAYPSAGYSVRKLPEAALIVQHLGVSYYFYEGVWYRHQLLGFSVITPPVGLFVPVLPRFYSTVWFAGIPYYYANDTYYVSAASRDGYVIALPPEGEVAQQLDLNDAVFVYPRNAQSQERQATDRYECYRWATDQAGFDVTQPLGGVSAAEVDYRRAAYRRAEQACLEARGYSVK